MDPDDGSADPLEDVSRTTPLGDPPTFTSDDDEGRGGSRRGGRPSRQRLPQHQKMSAAHHRPDDGESSQPGQLPTARPSWGDVHDIYGDDDTEWDHSPGDRSHREENEEEATVASLSTMDTETFKRLRDHRRLLKGSGNSDSTEVTRNDRYRDRGEGRGSSRRRRRRDDDTAVSHASHSYAPSHHSYNSHNSHHTASTASSEAPAYGNSRSRTHSRARHHTSGSSRRGKPSRGMRYPIPWQAVLLFALGTVLMAKMGVIELKLEKSQGRFLRGGEELVDEMNYRVGGVEVVRQRREEDVSAEDEGEEVQSEGEGEGEEKEIPKGDADKESAVDELLGEDEAQREDIEYSKAVEPSGNSQSGGNEQREADALSALPDLSPDNNPEVAPAFATDRKEPPSEQYFRKSLEELIQRMDSQRGGNADDDSFQADETSQQQQPENNVDEQQEKLALEQDREARQEQAQLIEERQKQQPLLTVNAGMDEQQHASAAAAAFGLNPEKHFPDQNLGAQQQSEAQQYNGGLAEWQARFDHSHGQNPQQLQPQPLQQPTPDVSVSEHLRNLPLFSQGHSGNHHLQAQQEKQPDLQTSHQYLSQSQTLAQGNGLQTPQQPIAPQQLEPLSPDQIQQQIQQQQPQQPQQQQQQGSYQNQNLDGPLQQQQQQQQQQQPYAYVQQQVPLVGQQTHVAPAQNVIIGQQAHQRGDSSQFAVVGGSFVHAVDADGNVVNDSNAPASGGGHLLASKASRGMQLGADGAPVPESPGPETNAEGAVEGGGSDDVQQDANSAPEPDTSGTNTNESPEADAGEEDGVDLLSKDPFHNDSRHFRREAPLHLFTDEEKKKLATLEKEEEQQAQTGDNTHREVADNEAPSSAGGNEAKEEPAQPPKRSVDDGIAHDNPRLWGVK